MKATRDPITSDVIVRMTDKEATDMICDEDTLAVFKVVDDLFTTEAIAADESTDDETDDEC